MSQFKWKQHLANKFGGWPCNLSEIATYCRKGRGHQRKKYFISIDDVPMTVQTNDDPTKMILMLRTFAIMKDIFSIEGFIEEMKRDRLVMLILSR